MKTLSIHASTPYSIYLDHGLLDTPLLAECCKKINKRIVILTDDNLFSSVGKKFVTKLEKQGLDSDIISFPAGEIYKTRETKQLLEDKLFLKKYGRDTCLIAVGGGMVTDLVGFLASTYCRGIPVIYIPTTLLAMVDASIGGKTGINTPYGKNLIGTFTQPHAVFMDIDHLKTLPQQEWHNGITEMIKHSIIANPTIFEDLIFHSDKIKNQDSSFLIEMIYASCLIKKNIVEQDEKENGIRQLLNFGHTIGHAIETMENYHISHGEAVAIGMLVESYLSVQKGYLSEKKLFTIERLLKKYDLPLKTMAFQEKNKFKKICMLDKKSIKNIPHFVLIDDIGKPHCDYQRYAMPVECAYIDETLAWASDYFN